MKDVVIRYTILENENGEGLYVIDFLKNAYIAYVKNVDIINNIEEPVVDSQDLEKIGIYLLKNIKEALNFSEEKTKKMIKYLYYDKIIKSKSYKIFILLLETYIIYYHVFLNAAVKNPFLTDFFEKEDIDNKIKIEIMKKLFNYLVNIKILENKLEILKDENILSELFIIIDKYKNIFQKDIVDTFLIFMLFKEIIEKLVDSKYEDKSLKQYIEDLIKILYGNINFEILSQDSNKIPPGMVKKDTPPP